jgi:hypothetical protein
VGECGRHLVHTLLFAYQFHLHGLCQVHLAAAAADGGCLHSCCGCMQGAAAYQTSATSQCAIRLTLYDSQKTSSCKRLHADHHPF